MPDKIGELVISRDSVVADLIIADGAAVSAALLVADFAGGLVYIPTSWTDANMGFKVSMNGTDYATLYDSTGVPVQISSIVIDAAGVYTMPDDVFAAQYIKLWSKSKTAATLTDVNQSGAITCTVSMKG